MLDTVILQIPIDYSAITDHSQFTPSTKGIFDNQQGFSRYVNNPTKTDRDKGIYKPKLTIMKRGNRIYLKIEFSAPKLLFGNNLEELKEGDFDEVVSKLRKTIEEMGVRLWSYQIEKAEVIAFHPSKNISLSKGYTSSFAIRELYKINLNQKLDLERVSFRNNGEALQLYSNRHSVVIYDKINDLNKPAKRAIDKDPTIRQSSLFDYIQKEKKSLEVLRFEVRLSHKSKMIKVLKEVSSLENPLFKDIFKKDLCQKILNFYWDNFFGKDSFLFNINNNPQKVLQMILMAYPKTNIRTAVMLVGLNLLCKDDEGIRGFRSVAKNYKPKTNWIALKRYLDKFNDSIFGSPAHGFIKDIQRSLNSFNSYKLEGN
jgi:hypothetical protein